jgi:F-type H+-transporting ATPase subunit delta
MYFEYKRITKVKITSAAPLSQDEIDKMLEKLKHEALLENIQLKTKVDEKLIGGFVLQYKDKQYDASILRQLIMLKRELDDNDYIKKLR